MKRRILIFLALLAPVLNAAPADAVLRWKNGETLHGDLAAASTDSVTWKSPFFENPFQLRWDAVDRIDWPAATIAPSDSFGIALRDGSFIYGDVTSITGDSISIHSSRHGDAVLKRSEVLSLRRLRHGDLLYSGPMGDQGWVAMTNQPNGMLSMAPRFQTPTSPLTTGPDESLLIRSWNRSASLDLVLPDRFDVEFRVRSSKRPQFLLSFGENIRTTLRVETWDDDLVLTAGDQFQVLRKIDDREREVTLRILWDNTAQKCWVYTPAGDLVTAWKLPHPLLKSIPGFIVLQNRGLDLSLDSLRVRAWDGKLPAKIDPAQPRVELADGRSVAGQVTSGASGSINVQATPQTAPANIPLAKVDALVFSPDPPQIPDSEMTLWYNDGTTIQGNIASVVDGHAAITTSFTSGPLVSRLDQLRELVIRQPSPKTAAPDFAGLDTIVLQGTTLHGKLSFAEDGALRWMPIGAVNAVAPSKSLASEITRVIPPGAPPPPDPALFYMTTGDVLPGRLQSIDRAGAEFQSSIMDPRTLPADELDAIEFAPARSLNVQGFDDPGWKIVKGTSDTVRRTNGALEMDMGTALFYPSLMQSSEIRFKFPSNGFSCVRLRMFCTENDSSNSINLLLGSTGNQFVAGKEASGGQFDNQSQLMTPPGQPVSVRLEIDEKKVEVFANDVPLQEIPIETASGAGSGLLIEPAGMWGNNVLTVSLSDFSARSLPGRACLPEVPADIKTQALTVPRFEKDDPPRHLLLAANGDVLRGEIEAATDSHFGFRSGLETLDVPRDRVTAVIWLKPPDPNAPATPPPAPEPSVLENRMQMRVNFGAVELNQYMFFLQSQAPGMKFKLPEDDDHRVVQLQIGGQTIGEALDAICERFDLHYHLDADGTIILESNARAPTTGLAFKSYWLKAAAFPAKPSAQEILTSKGITFPPDSSAQWEPGSGLLRMTNTAENQAKLAVLIKADFGGSLGSPSYWIQLAGGGRLALAVDRFGGDFIIGHNPAYGSIKIPTAQIYTVRTSPPDPTATADSLGNWRLVDAPEPVIPDSGGESSPLLGKDAASFSLPLLDGGNFDLAEQKGKVVVLDFWASWCGPCVESLPGVISTLAAFPSDRVKLIGVNQGETSAQVKHFLAARGLKLTVALDADESIGKKYGADTIPQTVIVGPDGKVAWTQTGYDPDGETEASATIKHLLETLSAKPPLH